VRPSPRTPGSARLGRGAARPAGKVAAAYHLTVANGGSSPALDEVAGLIDEERWSEALRALGPLRRSEPSNPDVWRAQALALQGAGELQEAQYAVDRWASLDEAAVEPIRLRADILDARGKHYAAVEVGEELTTRTPDDPDAYYRLARSQRAAGLITRARTSIERSLALDPRQWRAHELAGLIEMAGGRPADAAPHFRDALRLDPDNGQLAVSLQRALEGRDTKRSTTKSSTARRKKETRSRTRDLSASDRQESKRRRQAERQLDRGRRPVDGAGPPLSRWQRVWVTIVIVAILAAFVYLRYR
jgi:tetratricopeptide (TPR) repeat protein